MKLLGGAEEGTVGQKLFYGVAGIVLVLMVWVFLTAGANPILRPVVLPSPLSVLQAFPELFSENNLVKNMGFSIGLNLSGYLEAILILSLIPIYENVRIPSSTDTIYLLFHRDCTVLTTLP